MACSRAHRRNFGNLGLVAVGLLAAVTSPLLAQSYQVGDTGPAGGIIFFADSSDAYPDFDYLEVAPYAIQVDARTSERGEHFALWGPRDNPTTNAVATGLGEGKANTEAIVRALRSYQGQSGYPYAALIADDLVLGGYDDWYLPSIDELELVRTQVHLQGEGNFSSTYYWSSTERDAAQVYYSSFSNRGPTGDGAGYAAKGNNWYLRPVRAFREPSGAVAAVGPTVAAAPEYMVGDTGPAQGVIFYVDTANQHQGWTYLEVAPYSIQVDARTSERGEHFALWGPRDNPRTNAVATGLGDGKANTEAIVRALRSYQGQSGYPYAALIADTLILGGYDDWYLPSIDELELVRTQVHLQGEGNFSSTYYWSSTERDAAQVYYSSFSNRGPTGDGAGYAAKGNNWYLRPVRRF